MLQTFWLAGTGTGDTAPTGSEPLLLLGQFLPIILIVVVFYFFLIRPESKRKKAAAKMRNELIVGDQVTTVGGIQGKIVSIKDDSLVIETGSDRSRITVLKWAIQSKGTQISG